MENAPIDGLEKLERHLKVLVEKPDTPFDAKLFDDVELQLTPTNTPPTLTLLLPLLTAILTLTPHDPTPAASLATKLLAPLNFITLLSIAPPPSLTLALASSPPSGLLALAILEKAASSASDTALLATHPDLIAQLIRTWLASPAVGVGERATQLFAALLATDCPSPPLRRDDGVITFPAPSDKAGQGQGLLWRRIFGDKDIYASIFAMCSAATPEDDANYLPERQRSLAQARLLRLLPSLAVLDLGTLLRSHFPDAEKSYGTSGKGLVHFAAVEMVDREDVLMHVTLLEFFGELVREVSGVVLGKEEEASLRGLVEEAGVSDQLVGGVLEAMVGEDGVTGELVELLRRLGIRGVGES
ncbi:hypothetical protein V498_02882 [Pseudogymnoascus sp. VKM F-4517 (FW-2822)]|nr:hypothetical protein V498_02882 [Pseudogymnoascus sp. VKM F-4517 (FW-2822)]